MLTVQEANELIRLASNAPHPNLQSAKQAEHVIIKFANWMRELTTPQPTPVEVSSPETT